MTVFLGAIQDVYIYNLKQMKKFNSALINVFVYFSTIKNIRPAKIDIDWKQSYNNNFNKVLPVQSIPRYSFKILPRGCNSSTLNGPFSSLNYTCMKYHTKSELLGNNKEFLEFFRGFTDGEGSFSINQIGEFNFQFAFKIRLHLDDKDVLILIQKSLGVGQVRTYGKSAIFVISNLKDLQIIIDIFSQTSLNTTKHLNFLDFKKAYELWVKGVEDKKDKAELCESILIFKNKMNSKRSSFLFEESHVIRVTPYWLVGFVEGEGSFYIQKSNLEVGFSMAQSSTDEALMLEIKNFVVNLPNSTKKGYDSNKVTISYRDAKDNTKAVTAISITNMSFILDVLIPFFDSVEWHSKKKLDYMDWKTLIAIKEKGYQYLPEGKELIGLISSQMNNNRLSSSGLPQVDKDLLQSQITELFKQPSNYEIQESGQMLIKSKNQYFSTRKKRKVVLINEAGLVFKTFNSMVSCARFLGVYSSTVAYKVKNKKPVLFKDKLFSINEVEG